MPKYFRLLIGLFAMSMCASAQTIPVYYIVPSSKNGAPIMPNLRFNLADYNSEGARNFVFRAVSEHKKRKNKDNISAVSPSNRGVWDINMQLKYRVFGGEATFATSNSKAPLKRMKIRGKNPTYDVAIRFIQKNCKDNWFAYAIAKHESRQRYYVFNQFNSSQYKASIRGVPNCGLPDGWGIMQIDSARGSQITTEEVYNWQTNVLSGIKVMEKARLEAASYFEAVKRTYPDKWEDPPAYITISKTSLSYLDACVIQMYNGAAVVRRLKTPYGTYTYYRSAFEFDENASRGERWKFKPNKNNYTYKVVNHEIEGSLPSKKDEGGK